MRVVVTGAVGFIGAEIVRQLLLAGHQPVVVDSLDPSAHRGPPADLPAVVEHRWVDVTEPATWLAALDGADAVCHQAAKVGLGVDFSDVRDYVRANDVGTAVGLWAMHRTGFRGRLVLASSMVVYGEGAYRCPTHGPVRPRPRRSVDLEAGRYEPRCPSCATPLDPVEVDEDAPLEPRNVYAATKVHQEHLCAAFGREHDVAVTMLRYHNVYGPGMPRDTPYAGVASIFRSRLAAGLPPLVFEDGGQRRDFVHVHDVARANVAALTAVHPYDGPLNVASGHPRTIGSMANTIADATDPTLAPRVVGGFRLGDVRHIVANAQRAVDAIGFVAAVHPDDGLAEFASAPLRSPAA